MHMVNIWLGDKGYTINLFRKFNNGSKMGAFFTRTDLSFEDFGEGSFDKGVYLEIPFDNIFPIYSNNFCKNSMETIISRWWCYVEEKKNI